MDDKQRLKLLKNSAVIEEIKRHLWIESEKAGYDIGFEKAANDWLLRFSDAWMDYHLPKRKSSSQSSNTPRKISAPKKAVKTTSAKKKTSSSPKPKTSAQQKMSGSKRRSAKKYTK